MSKPPPRRWPDALREQLQRVVIDVDGHLDAATRRFETRFGLNRPAYIAAYRGVADARGVELMGRVLARPPEGGPREDDGVWDNLLNTYRRFDSREVAAARLRLHCNGVSAGTVTDNEGYYSLRIDAPLPAGTLWTDAQVELEGGSLVTTQPVLCVDDGPGIGVISDIDDTILQSSITNWKVAAQLTFLHNARTRKPLDGVAKLYQAFQAGADNAGRTPLFYVSSSPWNLYDLLDDFMELNGIPAGPIYLRDFGLDPGKFIRTPGHAHKLERARALIERFPKRRWILCGDSGQADPELYAEAAHQYGARIAAIYIRDVDPDSDSPLDAGVDAAIERIAGMGVPMLRARDSLAMAEHAAGLGLIAAERVDEVAREVRLDRGRPSLAEAAVDAATPGA